MAVANADLRDSLALTGSYVASNSISIANHVSVSVEVIVAGTGQALTCNLIAQWSVDDTNWVTEPVNIAGVATATEQPYTRLNKRFDFSLAATGRAFGETFNRWGAFKYFRVQVKESSGAGTTTALVQIKGTGGI